MIVRYHGALSCEDAQEMTARGERVIQSEGFLFVLNDMRQAGMPSSEARRYMQQWMARHPNCTMAHFGVSPPIRVILFLISRAMTLLGQRAPPYTPFASEAEARAWIDDFRRAAQHSAAP